MTKENIYIIIKFNGIFPITNILSYCVVIIISIYYLVPSPQCRHIDITIMFETIAISL